MLPIDRNSSAPDGVAPTPQQLVDHVEFVRSVAMALVRDPALADDVTQETLLAAIKDPPRVHTGLRPWLRAVVRNRVRLHFRSEARRDRRETRAAEERPSEAWASEALQRAETRQRVAGAVLDLSEPYRSAVILRYMEGLSPTRISEMTGQPVNTVKTHLQRALTQLRDRFDREEGRDVWTARVGALLVVNWGEPGSVAASAATSPTASSPTASSAAGSASSATSTSGLVSWLGGAVVVVALVTASWHGFRSDDSSSSRESVRSSAAVDTAAAPTDRELAGTTPTSGGESSLAVVAERESDPDPKPTVVVATGITVVREGDGAPIEGARLEVITFGPPNAGGNAETPLTGETDAQGAFDFDGEEGPFLVHVEHPDFASLSAKVSRLPATIELSVGEEFAFRVIDAIDGEAVAEARVHLCSCSQPGVGSSLFEALASGHVEPSKELGPFFGIEPGSDDGVRAVGSCDSTVTDADGIARLRLSAGKRYELCAQADGYAPRTLHNVDLSGVEGAEDHTFVVDIERGGHVELVRGSGAQEGPIHVSVTGASMTALHLEAGDRSVDVDFLAPGPYQLLAVEGDDFRDTPRDPVGFLQDLRCWLDHPGFMAEAARSRDLGREIDALAGRVVRRSFDVGADRGGRVVLFDEGIAFRVEWSESAAPLDSIGMILSRDELGVVAIGERDRAGFSFRGVEAGTYKMTVIRDDEWLFATEVVVGPETAGRAIVIDVPSAELAVHCPGESGVLHVRSCEGPVVHRVRRVKPSATSDFGGLPPGEYDVAFFGESGRFLRSGVRVESKSVSLSLTNAASEPVELRVVDANGRECEAGVTWIWRDRRIEDVSTDGTLRLPDGRYVLEVTRGRFAERFEREVVAGQAREVRLRERRSVELLADAEGSALFVAATDPAIVARATPVTLDEHGAATLALPLGSYRAFRGDSTYRFEITADTTRVDLDQIAPE